MIVGLVLMNLAAGMLIAHKLWLWKACGSCEHAREEHCAHGCEICSCEGWS